MLVLLVIEIKKKILKTVLVMLVMLTVKMAQLVLLILGDKKIFNTSISIPAKQIYVKAKQSVD